MIFSSLLGLLLLAEAVIVVVAIVSKDWIENELRTKFDDMVGFIKPNKQLLHKILDIFISG